VIPELCGSNFAVVFDILLLALTLKKVARVWRAGGRLPLLSLLVRDGILMFLAIGGTLFSNHYCVTLAQASRKRVPG
jgi:hypothetical protein